MNARLGHLLVVLAAFFAGLATMLTVIFVFSGPPGGQVANQPSLIGGAFQLTDQNGNRMTDQALKGRPTLIFFGFTHCPDVCPTALFEISEVLTKLGGDAARVNAFFVTVDPERDSPAKLKDYLSSFHPRLVGLTGSPEELATMFKNYRVLAKKVPQSEGDYTMDHSAAVYLMDKNGNFVAPFNLRRSLDEAAADLRRYL